MEHTNKPLLISSAAFGAPRDILIYDCVQFAPLARALVVFGILVLFLDCCWEQLEVLEFSLDADVYMNIFACFVNRSTNKYK